MKRIVLDLLRTLAVGLALHLQPSATLAQGTGFSLRTITNPAPTAGDAFGSAVAVLGTDRLLIGAWNDRTGATNAGAAYLFGISGALLMTFTNPTPAVHANGQGASFGWSTAAVGSDQVLIGAPDDDTGAPYAGVAYLFSTNGVLLTTFTNPTPAAYDGFGYAVAAVGADRVLIGAYGDSSGATGAAYLFRTDGALLTTFTNPTPAVSDGFGASVAAMGSNGVLIGAYRDDTGATDAGAVYLFNTNGLLLRTLTNPARTSGENFGRSIAAVGTDRVLIGTPHGKSGTSNPGVAYLCHAYYGVLTVFTNPTPAASDVFGAFVTVMGSDRVLIGAPGDDTGARDAGAVYLFTTNGVLLNTFTNPTPAMGDGFGSAVAAWGDRVLIGTPGDDTGASNAGAAYLFDALPPSLAIRFTPTNTVAVSWPSASTSWVLQQNTNGMASANWSNAPGPIQNNGTSRTLIVTPSAENRFYRLFKP